MTRMNINIGLIKKPSKRLISLLIVLFCSIAAIITLIVFIGFRTGLLYNDFSLVAKVNGEPVCVREFRLKLDTKSIEVFEYYKKKYGIENSREFWFSVYDGEVPAEVAKKQAFDEIVRIKVQQILAKEKGIIKSADYKEFLNELKKENKTRKDASKGNKVIYGPDTYGEIGYFNYFYDNIVGELKKKLSQKELLIPEQELVESYELLKNTQFKIPDTIRIQKINVSFADDKGIISQQKKSSANEAIEEAKIKLDNGEAFEKVAALYNINGEIIEQTFNKEDFKDKASSNNTIINAAKKLEIGEISEIIEGSASYAIIRSIGREEQGFIPYEEARVTIRNEKIDREYKNYIDDLVDDARIELNTKVFDRVNVRY